MTKQEFDNPDYYINREFSALAFNLHVLHQASDKNIPLLERLRFLFIVSSNLDEFFEIRVAGIKEQVAMDLSQLSIDGLTPQEVLNKISELAHQLTEEIYRLFNQELLPQLARQGICFIPKEAWNTDIKRWVKKYFIHEIIPVLSPVGLDLAHPFPRIVNKSLNFIVSLSGNDAFGRKLNHAIVHAPRSLPRAIRLPQEVTQQEYQYIHLASIIQQHVHRLFPGMEISGCYPFRLTRNSDLFLHEEEIEDLAKALKSELFTRHYGNEVRLEIDKQCPQALVEFLTRQFQFDACDIYYCDGPVNLRSYMTLIKQIDKPELKYRRLAHLPQELSNHKLFDAIKKKDILIHLPYQSFDAVVNFVHQAAQDPNVLAIKQTLYRTRSESIMVKALIEAARSGKEVTAVIELRARFDEASNLGLANRLQQAGVLVVYGVVGFKSHAKMTLVVRKEAHHLIHYVHLGTGNYHERTAKLYTDFGLLTANSTITHDIQMIFHQLTGLGKAAKLQALYHSPFTLQKKLLALIDECIQAKQHKQDSKIIIKVNGITDKTIIQALYRASHAGVRIHLIVRTLCCLRPGIEGVSDTIKVTSHIDRFLEHHRVFYFKRGRQESIYLSSADLMERNLYKRIEVMFPILDDTLKMRIKKEIIDNYPKANRRCWIMQSDGTYRYNAKAKLSAQEFLLRELSSREEPG